MKKHREYISQAIAFAEQAARNGEVPIGALVVIDDQIIGSAANEVEARNDPLAHAEMLAIRQAVESTGDKFLTGAALYCTLEPCPMCATAAVHARIGRIVYGAPDLRWGACGTLYNLPEDERLNHRIEIIGGVMEEECSELMRIFFRGMRN